MGKRNKIASIFYGELLKFQPDQFLKYLNTGLTQLNTELSDLKCPINNYKSGND